MSETPEEPRKKKVEECFFKMNAHRVLVRVPRRWARGERVYSQEERARRMAHECGSRVFIFLFSAGSPGSLDPWHANRARLRSAVPAEWSYWKQIAFKDAVV